MKLKFTVLGRPRTKERPRFRRNGGKPYTPPATSKYENEIWVMAQSAGAKQQMFADDPGKVDIPLGLNVIAYFAHPHRGRRKYPPTCDFDNVLKVVADGLAPAFRNDVQIVSAQFVKRFGAPERVEVELTDEVWI